MPDRRKGYIQKASIGVHKIYLHTPNMMMEKLEKFSLIQIKSTRRVSKSINEQFCYRDISKQQYASSIR